MSYIKAEYLWLDGTKPTALIRSKTKILKDPKTMRLNPPVWGFDGSSTNQAPGDASDCVLNPVCTFPDPIRGGNSILVVCEVLNTDGTPHESNTRHQCLEVHEEHRNQQMLFGLEQEYTFFQGNRPLGLTNQQKEQGDFYCGVGADNIYGREVVEEHLDLCLAAGLNVSGINAEVMPGQWEFQIGTVAAPRIADQLVVARWLLMRVAEKAGLVVSFEGKPAVGDWNGAGCHANVSNLEMRRSYAACVDACVALGERAQLHIENYGHGIQERLTGKHETCSYEEFRYGVSDRGASIRIPWQVEKNQKGYIEDRRPNANCDPYVVTRLLTEAICGG